MLEFSAKKVTFIVKIHAVHPGSLLSIPSIWGSGIKPTINGGNLWDLYGFMGCYQEKMVIGICSNTL
jgi:hypothetical protein